MYVCISLSVVQNSQHIWQNSETGYKVGLMVIDSDMLSC